MAAAAGRPVDGKDIYLLDGLQNLLDAWSDERAEASGEAVP